MPATSRSTNFRASIQNRMAELGEVRGTWLELTDHFPGTPATIRRHFQMMMKEGLVERTEHRDTGGCTYRWVAESSAE
jgi:predicted ArsR family transcriptional regulator